jgi:hypothetical protein
MKLIKWLILTLLVLSLFACDKLPTRNNIYDKANIPQDVGYLDIPEASCISISGYYAYIGTYSTFAIYDITNPIVPQKISESSYMGADEIIISGNYAFITKYIGIWGNYLNIFNISDPYNPLSLWSHQLGYENYGNWVGISGNYAYYALNQNLHIMNITNPSSPQEVGVYTTTDDVNAKISGAAFSGNSAYLACGTAGFQIVDISNPTNPVESGSSICSYSVDYIALSSNYAYLLCYDNESSTNHIMQVVDVSNPDSIDVISNYTALQNCFRLLTSGDYAYLSGYNNNFLGNVHILNISNPASLTVAGYYELQGESYSSNLCIGENYVYIVDDLGIHIINKF